MVSAQHPKDGSTDSNVHDTQARTSYEKFKAVEGVAVKELYSYYIGMRQWAGIAKDDATDIKIMSGFKKLFASYDKMVEVDLWKNLTGLWIKNSKTIPTQEERDVLFGNIGSIGVNTDKEEVKAFSRRMLADHVIFNPQVSMSVDGAEHYSYFVKNVVKKSRISDSYKGNDHAWWLVYDVLQRSWLNGVRDHKKEMEDGLEGMREREAPKPPVLRKPAPVPEIPTMDVPHPAPPPMPAAFRSESVVEGTVVVPLPPKPAEPVEPLLRKEELKEVNLEAWVDEKLKRVEPFQELQGEIFVIFEAETIMSARNDAKAAALCVKGNEKRQLENRTYNEALAAIDSAVSVNSRSYDHYTALAAIGIVRARKVNAGADREAILMAGLIASDGLISMNDQKRYMDYLNARLEAVKNGYTVMLDLYGKIYVARQAKAASAAQTS